MALAVAMVACTAAAGNKVGPAGPAGPPGTDAPTPEPTDPTTPTDPTPTDPTPTGDAPVVLKAFTPVYLALEGTGKALSKTLALDTHITDSDSQLKFTASSSDEMKVKLGAMGVNSRSVTITAVRVGTVTITVEARDGDNPALIATFPVTVVRNNAQPTTNDLSQLDRDKLEKRLYVSESARTDTVTVVAAAGGTSVEEVEDSIDGFKVVVGKDDAGVDDKVSVSVTMGTGANKYDIVVTPNPTAKDRLNKGGKQSVKIYPKDMFGVASSEAWEFSAMFNTTPKTLIASIPTIRLTRPGTVEEGTVDADGTAPDSAALILLSDYFNYASLQRMVKANADATAVAAGEIDEIGDTVCAVTSSPETLAFVHSLDETGTLLGDDANVVVGNLITAPEALGAIRIDSRYSSFGGDNIASSITNNPPQTAEVPNVETPATGAGAFDITIRCTDKDATAKVTGRVVVQQGS